MRNSKQKRLIKECDDIAREICYLMWHGKCCRCDRVASDYKDYRFAPHHVIRKGMGGANIQTRHLPFNILWTCNHHHTSGDDAFHQMTRQEELNWIEENEPMYYEQYQNNLKIRPLEGSMVEFLEARKRDLQKILDECRKEPICEYD